MQLGDLAWDYTDAYEKYDDAFVSMNRRLVIVLEYPVKPASCRFAKVLTLDGVVKKVPIEFLLSI
jgi:hypothetical protein